MLLLPSRLSCSRPQLLHHLLICLIIMQRHLQVPGEVLYLPPALLLQLQLPSHATKLMYRLLLPLLPLIEPCPQLWTQWPIFRLKLPSLLLVNFYRMAAQKKHKSYLWMRKRKKTKQSSNLDLFPFRLAALQVGQALLPQL